MFELQDNTKKNGGYLSILKDGKRAADIFPFAKGADEKEMRDLAAWMVEALNTQAQWEEDHFDPQRDM